MDVYLVENKIYEYWYFKKKNIFFEIYKFKNCKNNFFLYKQYCNMCANCIVPHGC